MVFTLKKRLYFITLKIKGYVSIKQLAFTSYSLLNEGLDKDIAKMTTKLLAGRSHISFPIL